MVYDKQKDFNNNYPAIMHKVLPLIPKSYDKKYTSNKYKSHSDVHQYNKDSFRIEPDIERIGSVLYLFFVFFFFNKTNLFEILRTSGISLPSALLRRN